MTRIPRISLDGARILTPAEMNAIHFETGLHTPAPKPAQTTDAVSKK